MSKIIIEAVERGVLIPYNSDSVNDSNVMSREEFIENIQQVDEEIEEEEEFGFDLDDPFAGFEEGGDDPFAEEVEEIETGPIFIPKREFSIFETLIYGFSVPNLVSVPIFSLIRPIFRQKYNVELR